MIEYDKDVLTITEILRAIDKFENKNEIIEALKDVFSVIETDWHMEDYYRNELFKYQVKEDKNNEV